MKSTVKKIRDGNCKLIDDLINYYKSILKAEFNYSIEKSGLIDDMLYKFLYVDINRYLFNENYKYSYNLAEYIKTRKCNYKKYLDSYINSIEKSNIKLDYALILAKSDKKYIYIIYKYYEAIIDDMLEEKYDIKIDSKYDTMKKNILYNSIKKIYKICR